MGLGLGCLLLPAFWPPIPCAPTHAHIHACINLLALQAGGHGAAAQPTRPWRSSTIAREHAGWRRARTRGRRATWQGKVHQPPACDAFQHTALPRPLAISIWRFPAHSVAAPTSISLVPQCVGRTTVCRQNHSVPAEPQCAGRTTVCRQNHSVLAEPQCAGRRIRHQKKRSQPTSAACPVHPPPAQPHRHPRTYDCTRRTSAAQTQCSQPASGARFSWPLPAQRAHCTPHLLRDQQRCRAHVKGGCLRQRRLCSPTATRLRRCAARPRRCCRCACVRSLKRGACAGPHQGAGLVGPRWR